MSDSTPTDGSNTPEVTISVEALRQLVGAGVLVQLITPWLKDDYLKENGYDHDGIDKALAEAGRALERLD